MFKILDKSHNRTAFNCGNDVINKYLQTMANQHAKKGISKTHVLADGEVIKAFYTLTGASLNNHQISGYPSNIPCVIIGRIGVDERYQGQGLSKLAIAHALQVIKQISHDIGIAFAVIDAKDETLARYYQRLGFMRIHDSFRLVYPVNQI